MAILGIETSCDETSVSVVEKGIHVKSNVISTSRRDFEKLAGVIPEQAARRQTECIMAVTEQALKEANSSLADMEAIAVTRGPGLLGSLLVGTMTARVLSSVAGLPLIGVHHTLGHLSSTWLNNGLALAGDGSDTPAFPLLTLSVSGGHSDLWYRTSHLTGMLIGRTRDDAAGEAFDKGASMLGLPYPGGPHVGKKAESGNEKTFPFPLPLHGDQSLDFSFSGLKTSLKYLLQDLSTKGLTLTEQLVNDVCASYQYGICKHLSDRVQKALERYPELKEVHIVGGVSANTRLREEMKNVCQKASANLILRVPSELRYCTDNAAMIASAGHFLRLEQGNTATNPFATQASIALSTVLQESVSR